MILVLDSVNIVQNPEPDPVAGPSSSLDYVDPLTLEGSILQEGEDSSAVITPDSIAEAALDPEIISALGASTSDMPEFGNSIHESLANLWTPLLKHGLPKEQKDTLFKDKDYLIPSNCKMLQAPKLNAEISAAASDVVRGRDKKFLGFQHQLGIGTSAINRAMDLLLSSDNKLQALKCLSDGCRILADLHYCLTKDRIKLVSHSLEKNFLQIIQESERDDTLFGNSLSEKIKASKAIERQGSQIRRTLASQKPSTVHSTAARPVPQGNWTGPPRYPLIRRERGGPSYRGQRPVLPPRRSYPPPPPTQSRSYQPRPRAPPRP